MVDRAMTRKHLLGGFIVTALLAGYQAAAQASQTETFRNDFNERLFQGSLVGAGIDPTAPAEIIRPVTTEAFRASLRKIGGVLEGGSSALTIQLNPYMLYEGNTQLYGAIVDKRKESRIQRWRQDSVITLSVSSGLPFETPTVGVGQFTTLGLSAAIELLGDRSIYSQNYSKCLTTTPAARAQLINNMPLNRNPPDFTAITEPVPPTDPNDAAQADTYKRALEKYYNDIAEAELKQRQYETVQAKREAARQAVVKSIEEQIKICNDANIADTHALFISLGARWVTPGLNRQPTDVYFVQREFIGATYEFVTPAKITVAGQLRLLGERSQPTPFQYIADGGLSLSYQTQSMRWSLDWTRSLLSPEGISENTTIAGAMQIRVSESLAVSLGLRGQGQNISLAMDQSALTVSLVYDEKPIFQQQYQVYR
jgi:hypothetical protein